jgi:hypothetical protein
MAARKKESSRVYKPLFEEKDLGINPFVCGLQIPVSTFTQKDTYHKDKDGDLINKQLEMEYTPFTKVYTKAIHRQIINGLSDKSQRLYLWLIYEADSNKDFVWINTKRYMDENLIKSLSTYHNAIKELTRYCIIQQSVVKGIYWTNPDFFFQGNRVTKFPNNVVYRQGYEN